MLTWRELSVCATKLGVQGMSFGCTVTTVTSGTGRCGGGASFEQPADECDNGSEGEDRSWERDSGHGAGLPWS